MDAKGDEMSLTEEYYGQVKNVEDIFSAIKNAQAPEKFTTKFLYDLGYTSINDRPFVKMLKALGFLDENSIPQQRYYDYLDDDRSRSILAQGVREAYGDLFSLNQKAYEMDNAKVKGKLKSLLQGKKSDAVLTKMATTFTTLCQLADFENIPRKMEKQKAPQSKLTEDTNIKTEKNLNLNKDLINLSYSINIELPVTRDRNVYDAIFKSIKENLL